MSSRHASILGLRVVIRLAVTTSSHTSREAVDLNVIWDLMAQC